jgi:DNA-binding MarR family transcriptional regulator
MRTTEAITWNDRRLIDTLLSALPPISNLRESPLPLRTVTAFLMVAGDQGRALNDYARDLKIHRAYTSSIIHDLADHARDGSPGLGLIQIYEEKRGKRQEISLTKKGHAVAEEMFNALRNRQMLSALQPFLNLRPVSLRTVTAFLIIASDEGKSLTEYAGYLKIHRSTMASIIHDLADRARGGGPGLGLVQIDETLTPGKSQAVFLTEKGYAIAQAMFEPLRSQQILVA